MTDLRSMVDPTGAQVKDMLDLSNLPQKVKDKLWDDFQNQRIATNQKFLRHLEDLGKKRDDEIERLVLDVKRKTR